MRWVASDDCETDAGAAAMLDDVHGVLIPAASASAASTARSAPSATPATAVFRCSGCAWACSASSSRPARSVGLNGANSAEFDPATPDPVIATMADQRDAVAGEADLGGTMRWAPTRPCCSRDPFVAEAYRSTTVSERHRHRYEVNNAYRDRIAESGLKFSGTSPDGHLVEFVEYPADVHPFLVGTQAHPELKSRPTRPHPLFVSFIGAAIDYKAAERLPVEIPEQHANGRGTRRRRAVQPLPDHARG